MKSPEVLRLNPYHRLLYDIHMAVIFLSSKIKETNTYLAHCGAAIQIYETILKIGHPDLAYLYNAYGLTLCKSLLEKESTKEDVKEKAQKVYYYI